ncbi:MAG: T9SS type A sorting domain-containing protein [Bacteroidia bacterium]
MTKFYRLLFFALFVSVAALAQPTVLPPGVSVSFFTSFEQPTPFDSMTGTGTPGWEIDANYRFPTNATGGQAARGRVSQAVPQATLTSEPFSTVGSFKVWLDFAHICKIEQIDSARVEISVNGGTSWTPLTGANCLYLGTSGDFRAKGSFSQFSYPVDWQLANLAAVPTAAWWKQERFDISNIASNQADVRIRFRMRDNNNNGMGPNPPLGPGYGWLLDSVLVTRAFSEVIPPLITHTPITGMQFNITQTISATVRDSFGCDSTGVGDVWAFYSVNSSPYDSMQLNRQGTTLTWSGLLDTSRVSDGDTVRYFLRARDSSPLQNVKYFPLQSTPGDTVITYLASFFPTVTHTPITGYQFSAGPFAIQANISDASGIDSAILHYRLNSGPWQLKRMPLISGITYRDTITPIDGDTVDYYIEAVDNSARRFRTIRPDTAAFWRFWASGDPDIFWPSTSAQCDVFLGAIFNLGPFNVGVRALDGSGIDTVFLYYRVNSGSWDTVGMVRNPVTTDYCNWIGTIPSTSDSDTVSYYVRAIDASVRANFRIDPDPASPRQFVSLGGIRFPFNDNFDASDVWRPWIATGSLTAPSLTPGGWVRGAPAKSTLNSARSAPNAWMPGPINGNYPNNVWYILESPVFDFSQAENAILSFWQWRDINNGNANTLPGIPGAGDGFWVEYSTNINATTPTWQKLGTSFATDTNQTNWYNRPNITGLQGAIGGAWDGTTSGWERCERRLVEPQFQGANGAVSVKFRFVFRSNASIQANGVLIDDLTLRLPPQRDLALTTLASNAFGQEISMANNNFQILAGDSVGVFLRMRNFGLQTIDTVIPVVVEILGTTYRDTSYLQPGQMLPNAFSSQAVRLNTIPSAPARWFTIRAYSLWPGDENLENDTVEVEMFGVPKFTVPASDNFDTPENNWLPLATGINAIIWERGSPTGGQLSSPATAPNVWGTILNGAPPTGSSGFLLSPLYDFSSSVNTKLRFKMNRRITTGGGIRVTFTDGILNQGWQTLGAVNDPAGVNWYNAPTIPIGGVTGPGWNQSSTSFVTHELELPPAFNYRQGAGVRFRFAFQNANSGAFEGVIIDDFEILPPPPIDIGLLGILAPVSCPDSIRAFDSVRVIIRNYGGDTINQIPFNFNFNNGPLVLANDFIYNDPIPPAVTRIVVLPAFAAPQPPGNYDMKVFIRLTGDARASNDTAVRCIRTMPPVDLVVVQPIVPPPAICYPSGPQQVRFVVRNQGHSPTTTFTAGYRIDTLPSVTQQFTRTINFGQTDTLALTVPVNIPNGWSRIKMFVNDPLDPRRGNDTTEVIIFGREPIRITHVNDFERSLLPYCDSSAVNAIIEVIDNLVPSTNPSNKVLLMGTRFQGTSFNVNVPANPWVETWNPTWLSRIAFPVETVGMDSIRIRFSLLQLAGGAGAADRISLFRVVANGRQIGPTLQPTTTTPASNPYVQYDFRLDTVYTPGEPLIIEFQSKTRYPVRTVGPRNGNLIDDLIIYNSRAHSAEVLDVTYNPPFPSATTPVSVTALIRNNGNLVMNNVQANLVVNGTLLQTTTPNLNLPFMKDSAFTFTTTFNPNLGNNDVCVYTANPNGQPDGFPSDDTLCTIAVGFPVIDSFPYCNDFDSNLPEWLSRNPFTLRSGGNNWIFGTPNKGFINGAASGQNAWFIGEDSLVRPYDSSALYTPIFQVNQGECYRISFKTKFLNDFWNNDTLQPPLLGDGGTLEYSTDGGINFTNFGRLDTVAFEWYNNMVQSLRDFNSTPWSLGYGWTAKSPDNWTTMRQIFNTTNNTLVLFRFRYGSDDAFHGEGFAVDDFCFELVPGPCGLVSVEDLDADAFELRQNYPNPSAYLTTIEYRLPAPGKVKVFIKDMLGREIYKSEEGQREEGWHSKEIDLTRMQAGVYFYTVNYNGIEKTMKMIVGK